MKLNGKCSFIDKTGREVVLPKYDVADSFSEDSRCVGKVPWALPSGYSASADALCGQPQNIAPIGGAISFIIPQ